MLIKFTGGRVYDPMNGVNGRVADIYARDGRIVAGPNRGEKIDQEYALNGTVVMAGAIDPHSHIGGGKVTIGRMLMPEDHLGKEVAALPAGQSPYGLALSKDGRKLFVTDTASSKVLVFNTADNSPAGEIEVERQPYAIETSPDGKLLFVSNRGSETVSIVDIVSHEVISNVTVGKRPSGMAILPEGDKLYVANELSANVSVVNVGQGRRVEDISVGTGPNQIVVSTPEIKKALN